MANWILGFFAVIEWAPFLSNSTIIQIQLLAISSLAIGGLKTTDKNAPLIVLLSVSLILMIINSVWTGVFSYFIPDILVIIYLIFTHESLSISKIFNGMFSALLLTAIFQICTFLGIIDFQLPIWIQEVNGDWVNTSPFFKAQIGFNNKYNNLSVLYALLLIIYINTKKRISFLLILLLIGQSLTIGRSGMLITLFAIFLCLRGARRAMLLVGFIIIGGIIGAHSELSQILVRSDSNISRLVQYESVINSSFADIGILGRGFGYNLFESGAIHIHNFFLNSYVAMGLIGLIWSLIFFFIITLKLVNMKVAGPLKGALLFLIFVQAMVENLNYFNMSVSYILLWSILIKGRLAIKI